MDLQIATLCDAATEYGDQLCLLGTFDTIEADTFPVSRKHSAYVIQVRWSREEQGHHTVELSFANGKGEKTLDPLSSSVQVDVPAGREFAVTNFIVNLENLSFSQPGLYRASVTADSQLLGSVDLQVVRRLRIQSSNN